MAERKKTSSIDRRVAQTSAPKRVVKKASHTNIKLDPAQIAQRAYEMFLRRGGTHGHDLEDWLAAEQELRGN